MEEKESWNFFNADDRLKHMRDYRWMAPLEPYMITVTSIRQKDSINWIESKLGAVIIKKSFTKVDDLDVYEEVHYLLEDKIFIHIHSDYFIDILFYEESYERTIDRWAEELKKFQIQLEDEDDEL